MIFSASIADRKNDSGLRLRLSMAALLSGAHKPQLVGTYQLTTAGTIRTEDASEKSDASGHAFVLSYVHPIMFEKAHSDEDETADPMSRGQGRRDLNQGDPRNNRKRRPQPRG